MNPGDGLIKEKRFASIAAVMEQREAVNVYQKPLSVEKVVCARCRNLGMDKSDLTASAAH